MKVIVLPSDYRTVIAPKDSRSNKDKPIWSGNCTYLLGILNLRA
jgi:hypothetical protein